MGSVTPRPVSAAREVRLFDRWLARRSVARSAIACLALGLATLAVLALWGSVVTRQTTERVRSFNQVSGKWNHVFTQLGNEDAALRDFVATNGSSTRRVAFVAQLDSAAADLRWLERHGGSDEATHVRMLRAEYESYNRMARAVLNADADPVSLRGYGDLAMSVFTPLRGQVVANVERVQGDLADYLEEVDRTNQLLRSVDILVIVADAVFCLGSTVVLLGYQRRAERAAQRSRYQSLHDPLTGLANRKLLTEHLDKLTSAGSDGPSAALLLIDLNRFKQVNDTYGHHCGDALLQTVGRRMVGLFRDGHVVARLGGDEFAVLLHDMAAPEAAWAMGDRLRRAIEQPIELAGHVVDVGASVGVSMYPLDGTDAASLLQYADAAMYTAKRAGLGVQLYQPNDADPAAMPMAGLADPPRRPLDEPCLIGPETLTRSDR